MAYQARINRAFQAVFLIIIFLALLGVFGMIWWIKNVPPAVKTASYYQPAPTPGSELTTIENSAKVNIPDSARNIYATLNVTQTSGAWVRLDLPAGDLPEFLASTRCQQPLVPADPKAYQLETQTPGSIPDWWQPYNAARLEACSITVEYIHQQILADATKGDTVTVYVYTAVGSYPTPTLQP